jgi:hypothetical protein
MAMWYFEAKFGGVLEDVTTERYEGLTEEQARSLHSVYYDKGAWQCRSGEM